MSIEIAGISLTKIHSITTRESADFVSHRIPGLEGNLTQDMGRNSVRLRIQGIFFGETAIDDQEALRAVYKSREPVDFLAEIVGQAYFAQVILEQFEVNQNAAKPDQYSFVLHIAEYVVPPEPVLPDIEDVDASILDEALDFMDIAELPEILSLPEFRDPTVPLNGMLDGVETTVNSLTDETAVLTEIFGEL